MAAKKVSTRPWAKGERVPWYDYFYPCTGAGSRGELGRQAWKKLGARIKSLRGSRCEACGTTEREIERLLDCQLELHHRYYIEGNRVTAYPLDAFWVLCSSCHDLLRVAGVLRFEEVSLADIRQERDRRRKLRCR